MKKILFVVFALCFGLATAQEVYFQGPYFERYYSTIDFSQLATLEPTLAIREVVQSLGEMSDEATDYVYISNQVTTNAVFDLLEGMYAPVYDGDTADFREWLETYYTPEALEADLDQYYYDEFYAEALAGSDDYMNTNDFADALMMFLTASYIGTQLQQAGTPAKQDLAVRQQIRAALAKSPRFNALSEEEKQFGAHLLLFFTSRIMADFGVAMSESTCAANDTTPGPAEATFYCGRTTELDLVGAFSEGVAQVFGFRVPEYVLIENGFERFERP